MPVSFPTTGLVPNVTTYSYGGRTWLWNGSGWQSQGTIQGVTGAQGIQGLQGVQGIIGAQGVVSQSTPPSNTGTLWLDTSVSPATPMLADDGNLVIALQVYR
jgi:hypothetical protein